MDEKAQFVEVVAAVIERDGMILICQRKDRGKHALKWEFPGGKVEPGEGYREALVRELTEELGIDAVIGGEIERYDFQYAPAISAVAVTRLIFFSVTQFQGELRNLDFTQVRWELRAKLPEYDFLEGDVDFVKRLVEKP